MSRYPHLILDFLDCISAGESLPEPQQSQDVTTARIDKVTSNLAMSGKMGPSHLLRNIFVTRSSVYFYSYHLSRWATEQAVVPPACKRDQLKAAMPRVVWWLFSTLLKPSFISPNILLAEGKNHQDAVAFLQLAKWLCVYAQATSSCWRSRDARRPPRWLDVTDGSVHRTLHTTIVQDCPFPPAGNSPLQENAVSHVQNCHCLISQANSHPVLRSPAHQDSKWQ